MYRIFRIFRFIRLVRLRGRIGGYLILSAAGHDKAQGAVAAGSRGDHSALVRDAAFRAGDGQRGLQRGEKVARSAHIHGDRAVLAMR